MRRRDLLKAAGAGVAALAAPRIGRAERTDKLVFVSPADLSVLDPVITPAGRRATTPISSSTRFMGSIRAGRPSLRWSRGIKSRRMG
jgi:hypothetical protein